MTNREWLNSLSDEEFMKAVDDDGITICQFIKCKNDIREDCASCKLQWLKQEHKDE